MSTKRVRKAVLPVGGMGTRFLPATKSMPKEMFPVVDRPVVHYVFEEARNAGIEQFILVTSRNKATIDNHFDHAFELERNLSAKGKEKELELASGWLPEPGNLVFTRQQAPLGLGHAVWCARNFIGDEPFAVLLPDDMMLADVSVMKQMVDAYQGGNMTAVEDVPLEKTSSYGVLEIESDDGRVVKAKSVVEKPKPADAPSRTAIAGRYILDPGIFDVLEKQGTGSGGEIQLTDAIASMMPNTALTGFRFDGKRYDCGNKVGFLEANIAYALGRTDMVDDTKDMLKRIVAEL